MLHLHLSNFFLLLDSKVSFKHQQFKYQRGKILLVILLFYKLKHFIHFARESEPHLPYLCDLLCDILRAVFYIGGAEQLHPGSGR